MPKRSPLTIDQILDWADAFRERTGRWPIASDGPAGLPDTTWNGVDQALMQGHRGLFGGSSLAQLLRAHRGKRHRLFLPPLTDDQILRWADAHHRRTGAWPTAESGPIPEAPGDTWSRVESALRQGVRGHPGGSSLAQLLHAHRGKRHPDFLPPLTDDQILRWADAHHRRTGAWPTAESGPIPEAPEETWSAVETALRNGLRGQPGESSLARLLAKYRGVRNRGALPRLTAGQILDWADAHHVRTGQWPTEDSGPIPDVPGEVWSAVDTALVLGGRGLPGGNSLPQLLARYRGVRNPADLPRLTVAQVLGWADAHHARTGRWPTRTSGPIPDALGDTWEAVQAALTRGRRGLPGGDTLAQFLARHRGKRNHTELPPLTPEQILGWADAHHVRTGRWPTRASGPIPDAPGEAWSAVDAALTNGHRGLPGGSSLARFLAEHRGVRNRVDLPPLTAAQILVWADAHHARTGAWPIRESGPIEGAPGETWFAIHAAVTDGRRGLPGGSSLARFLAEHRGVRNRKAAPPLTLDGIRRWARAHHRRTGAWPVRTSGPIPEAPGETWSAVSHALVRGARGLPGGASLAAIVRACRAGGQRGPGAGGKAG